VGGSLRCEAAKDACEIAIGLPDTAPQYCGAKWGWASSGSKEIKDQAGISSWF